MSQGSSMRRALAGGREHPAGYRPRGSTGAIKGPARGTNPVAAVRDQRLVLRRMAAQAFDVYQLHLRENAEKPCGCPVCAWTVTELARQERIRHPVLVASA